MQEQALERVLGLGQALVVGPERELVEGKVVEEAKVQDLAQGQVEDLEGVSE